MDTTAQEAEITIDRVFDAPLHSCGRSGAIPSTRSNGVHRTAARIRSTNRICGSAARTHAHAGAQRQPLP